MVSTDAQGGTPVAPAHDAPFPRTSSGRPRGCRRGVAGPLPSAEHVLAVRASEVQRTRADAVPDRWRLPGFAREVELVRRQLSPLRDRGILVASYEREGARVAALRHLAEDPTAPPPALDPLDAAYAVRWLELTHGGAALPTWERLVGEQEAVAR